MRPASLMDAPATITTSVNMATNLFTLPEAAEYFGVSRQRIWKLVTDGRIKAQRVGQAWLIAERDLLKIQWKRAGRPSNHHTSSRRRGEK